jgi:nitroreductase
MDALEAIATRRSRSKMRQDVPARELIERVLEAGVQAPNHHETQPWRFFVLTGDARSEFGDALARALAMRAGEIEPTKLEALIASERSKPMRSPVIVVVGVASERDDPMTRREDLQAASAALQNMLLAAHAIGLATVWRTGDGAYDDSVKGYFGLRPLDEIAGVLYLGYADEAISGPPQRSRDYASKTEWRGW